MKTLFFQETPTVKILSGNCLCNMFKRPYGISPGRFMKSGE